MDVAVYLCKSPPFCNVITSRKAVIFKFLFTIAFHIAFNTYAKSPNIKRGILYNWPSSEFFSLPDFPVTKNVVILRMI
jgi:hypothetical protein